MNVGQVPLVSVVIPTFNRARELGEALASVTSQTYSNLEVIVVDDGSTDDTANVVARCPLKVAYLPQDHSGLPAVARNAGIRHASGRYVAFLDSDDAWLPGKLERQVALLEKEPDVGIVCTNALVRRGNEPSTTVMYPSNPLEGVRNALPVLLQGNQIALSTVMCRRQILERVGGFCEDPRLTFAEDYDLWLRCASVAGFHYISDPLMIYLEASENSLSARMPALEQARIQSFVYRRGLDFMSQMRARVPAHVLIRSQWIDERRMYRALAAEGSFMRAIAPGLRAAALRCLFGWHRLFRSERSLTT